MTTITKSNSYKTSDGQSFDTHAKAKAHQDYLDRVARLQAAFPGVDEDQPYFNIKTLAANADDILAALNKPVVPRKKAVA